MLTWDANLYLQFANERTQPSLDLVARIAVSHPQRIIDLGCGPGNSTQILHRHWSKADIIGLDNSPEMIARCIENLSRRKMGFGRCCHLDG